MTMPETPRQPDPADGRDPIAEAAFVDALRRVMETRAPESLRARVLGVAEEAMSHDAHDGVLRAPCGQPSVWAAPARANRLAVAAALLLVAGAVLFGILGPRIGTRVPSGGSTTVAEVAAVVSSTHEQFSEQETCGMQRSPWRSPEDASRELSRLLVRQIEVPNLNVAGFEFCCGGQSRIPGAGDRSGHLLYCRTDGDRCAWLSVFVTPVETRFLASDAFGRTGPLDCGIEYYRFLAPGAGDLFYWCDGKVTWFVKANDPADFEIVRHFFPDALNY